MTNMTNITFVTSFNENILKDSGHFMLDTLDKNLEPSINVVCYHHDCNLDSYSLPKKDNISPGIQIGGSFSMYYHVKKKYGIKMLTEANNNNIKGYFTDFDRWFLLLLCNSNFINTTNETA